jgi:TonB family C-terminal domain
MKRNLIIICSVVAFHVAALWALQTGLLRRAVEIVVPVEILSEFMTPTAPQAAPTPPVPPKSTPVKQPVAKSPMPVRTVTPQPVAVANPAPSPTAPVSVTEQAPVLSAQQVASAVPPPAPTSPHVELPSSNADYLQNPKPPYPALSKRLGEQGKVVVRVLIGTDGTAQQAEIRQSSGYERLDQAALGTVLRWHYVPGKRAGVPEAMWFNVPINFVLE